MDNLVVKRFRSNELRHAGDFNVSIGFGLKRCLQCGKAYVVKEF